MSIDLVVLDIAGTTLEEHGAVYAALEAALVEGGATVPEGALERVKGASKHEAVAALLAEGPPVEDGTVDRIYDDFRERLLAAYRERPPEPFAGVPEALADLRARGIKVVLSTGFERGIAEPLLGSVGWDGGTIDALVCGSDVPRGRPAPYMIYRAMEVTGVIDAGRVLVGGDTNLDLLAGTNARAGAVVGVLTGSLDAATLGRTPHTHLLASAAELPRLLDNGLGR
jgi:phosphonatase-like hydrolase